MPAALSDEDKAFIRAILDHPEELTTWLVYADWLDERGDPRAEFLRLSVERNQLAPDWPAEAIDARLAALRETLDPNWMLAFDTGPLANCRGVAWRLACPLSWDQLAPTDEPDIRICHSCKSPVFFCHTAEEARLFASCGQCVALSTRIPPSEHPQPEPQCITVGLMAYPDDEGEEVEILAPALFPRSAQPPPPPRRRPWWKFW